MLTQLREEMIPMMDGLKEYLGMIHELPDFVQINRVRTLAIYMQLMTNRIILQKYLILNQASTPLSCWVSFPKRVNIFVCLFVPMSTTIKL